MIAPHSLRENHIQRAFSKAAHRYENLSGIQKDIGQKLMGRIPGGRNYRAVLDVGMGTGCLTNRLASLFPEAKVFGLDFADGMVSLARQKYDHLRVVQADAAALPFKDDAFDLIVSNSAYQWVDNLENAFKLSYSSLRDDGVLCLAVFCRKSCVELFESLRLGCYPRVPEEVPSRRLPDPADVCLAVEKAGFVNIEADREIIKFPFPDMMGVLKWLKNIGANSSGKRFYLGKDRLREAGQYYKQHFALNGGVYASFEILLLTAEKGSYE